MLKTVLSDRIKESWRVIWKENASEMSGWRMDAVIIENQIAIMEALQSLQKLEHKPPAKLDLDGGGYPMGPNNPFLNR